MVSGVIGSRRRTRYTRRHEDTHTSGEFVRETPACAEPRQYPGLLFAANTARNERSIASMLRSRDGYTAAAAGRMF
jgi:hypothetical protein